MNLVAIILCLFLEGCSDANEERRKEEWIQKEVALKIQQFKSEKLEECMSEILLAAEADVDSILSQKDLFGNIINQEVPDKPVKPEYIPLDSAAIKNHQVKKVINNN